MNRAMMALLDRHVVHDVVTKLYVRIDDRDWEGVRSCLASEVHFDMSDVGAGAPRRWDGDALAEEMERALAPLDATHHQIGSVVVDVDSDAERATVRCHGLAFHHREGPDGPDTRMYAGRYTFGLRQEKHRWRIDDIRFELRFAEGGTVLETLPL